jgi:hypothetical protein
MAVSLRIIAALLVAGFALVPATASATGTLSIHRTTGASSSYNDVEIKVFSGSLFLTSDDGNGTIVITRAACSYQGKILVCFPLAATLVQDGESSALNLKSGTIYFNDTDDVQQMSRSTTKLSANSIIATLSLRDGTLISAQGKMDEVIR